MIFCNPAAPWKHFQHSFQLKACQLGKPRAYRIPAVATAPLQPQRCPRVFTVNSQRRRSFASVFDDEHEAWRRSTKSNEPVKDGVDGEEVDTQAVNRPGSASTFKARFTKTRAHVLNASVKDVGQPEKLGEHTEEVSRVAPVDRLALVQPSKEIQMCTILTSKPDSMPLEKLLSLIPPFEVDTAGARPLLVFLLTPAYASEAVSDPDAFAGVMSKAINVPKTDFDTLVAIVDRLPKPSPAPSEVKEGNTRYRADSPPTNDNGSEGMAFVSTALPILSGEEQEAWDLSHTATQDSRLSPLSGLGKSASLTFNLLRWSKPPPYQKIDHIMHSFHSYQVQMPLASTVFHNGIPYTMIQRSFSVEEGSAAKCVQEKRPKHLDITLPLHIPRPHQTVAIGLPLVVLTGARPVLASMGNIVRQLGPSMIGNVEEMEAMPASQELESAIDAYHKALGVPSQTVSVWAFVIPRQVHEALGNEDFRKTFLDFDSSVLEELWTHENPQYMAVNIRKALTKLIQSGARLCRVLSGGGGWGKKAGLLSLDPDAMYSASQDGLDSPWLGDEQVLGTGDGSPLPEIAQVGDFIQFYIAPEVPNEPPYIYQDRNLYGRRQDWRSLDFGVIPNTIDVVPGDISSAHAPSSIPRVTRIDNHFGALSEVGMAVNVETIIRKRDATQSRKRDTIQNTSNWSKVDVPFGRFSLWDDEFDPPSTAVRKSTKDVVHKNAVSSQPRHQPEGDNEEAETDHTGKERLINVPSAREWHHSSEQGRVRTGHAHGLRLIKHPAAQESYDISEQGQAETDHDRELRLVKRYSSPPVRSEKEVVKGPRMSVESLLDQWSIGNETKEVEDGQDKKRSAAPLNLKPTEPRRSDGRTEQTAMNDHDSENNEPSKHRDSSAKRRHRKNKAGRTTSEWRARFSKTAATDDPTQSALSRDGRMSTEAPKTAGLRIRRHFSHGLGTGEVKSIDSSVKESLDQPLLKNVKSQFVIHKIGAPKIRRLNATAADQTHLRGSHNRKVTAHPDQTTNEAESLSTSILRVVRKHESRGSSDLISKHNSIKGPLSSAASRSEHARTIQKVAQITDEVPPPFQKPMSEDQETAFGDLRDRRLATSRRLKRQKQRLNIRKHRSGLIISKGLVGGPVVGTQLEKPAADLPLAAPSPERQETQAPQDHRQGSARQRIEILPHSPENRPPRPRPTMGATRMSRSSALSPTTSPPLKQQNPSPAWTKTPRRERGMRLHKVQAKDGPRRVISKSKPGPRLSYHFMHEAETYRERRVKGEEVERLRSRREIREEKYRAALAILRERKRAEEEMGRAKGAGKGSGEGGEKKEVRGEEFSRDRALVESVRDLLGR